MRSDIKKMLTKMPSLKDKILAKGEAAKSLASDKPKKVKKPSKVGKIIKKRKK